MILSCKLRCYTSISILEKSRNNTCEKDTIVFDMFDTANQLLISHLSFVKLCQSPHQSQSGLWLLKHRKFVSLTDSDVRWPWRWHFSRLRTKIDNWKICHRRRSWKDFFCRWGKVNKWEFCKRKLRPLFVLKWFNVLFM